jgi:hypothetical protein
MCHQFERWYGVMFIVIREYRHYAVVILEKKWKNYEKN